MWNNSKLVLNYFINFFFYFIHFVLFVCFLNWKSTYLHAVLTTDVIAIQSRVYRTKLNRKWWAFEYEFQRQTKWIIVLNIHGFVIKLENLHIFILYVWQNIFAHYKMLVVINFINSIRHLFLSVSFRSIIISFIF